MGRVFVLFAALIFMSPLSPAQLKPQKQPPRPAAANLDTLVEQFFNENYFKFGPTGGTAAGFRDPCVCVSTRWFESEAAAAASGVAHWHLRGRCRRAAAL